MQNDLKDILTLPSDKHSIKEAVLTLFFKNPFEDFQSFTVFYDKSLKSLFSKKEEIFNHQVELEPSKASITRKEAKLSSYRLYRVNNNSTDLLVQVVNEFNRHYISFHCLDYKRWQDFKSDFIEILKVLGLWVDESNYVVAFSLHYIDQMSVNDDKIPLDLIFNNESSLLPSGIFKSKNSFLVFNSEKESENDKYDFFDRIELKIQGKEIFISHNSIIPIEEQESFKDFIRSSICLEKIEHAHQHNKNLLKDILSTEVQRIIGLV